VRRRNRGFDVAIGIGGHCGEQLTDRCAIGIKAKVENKGQYDQYLEELKPLREELGVSLKEDLYPEEAK
jgi:hypothetical protein